MNNKIIKLDAFCQTQQQKVFSLHKQLYADILQRHSAIESGMCEDLELQKSNIRIQLHAFESNGDKVQKIIDKQTKKIFKMKSTKKRIEAVKHLRGLVLAMYPKDSPAYRENEDLYNLLGVFVATGFPVGE